VIKDRLYCDPPDSPGRRAAQQVIYRIGRDLAALMAPILCFTAEDIWSHLPKEDGAPSSIHLAPLPPVAPVDEELAGRVEGLIQLRDLVLKQLEPFRAQKHHSLDARVTLHLDESHRKIAAALDPGELADLFIVSAVEIRSGDEEPRVEVSLADGAKCPRCWKRTAGTGDRRHPDLCPRCRDTLDGLSVTT